MLRLILALVAVVALFVAFIAFLSFMRMGPKTEPIAPLRTRVRLVIGRGASAIVTYVGTALLALTLTTGTMPIWSFVAFGFLWGIWKLYVHWDSFDKFVTNFGSAKKTGSP